MDQGSDNWHKWRAQGIGGSDAPIIMNVSPWKTAFVLWEEKTGRVVKEQGGNFATERGNRLEPIARAKYELEYDFEMGAATCQHETLPYMRASMDGWNPKLKRGLEIKCPGKPDHEKARAGEIPEKYWPQLQHQFIVTGAEVIDYYSYWMGKDVPDHMGEGIRIEVKPDFEYIKTYLKVAAEFWRCVTENVPPGMSEDDFKKNRLIIARKSAEEWKRLAKERESLQTQINEVESKLFEYGKRVQFQGTGVRTNDGKVEVFDEQERTP
jgi:putative phage-type endonuclease